MIKGPNVIENVRLMNGLLCSYSFGRTGFKPDKAMVNKGWIMEYLYYHQGEVVYQKDIETSLHLPKSTIATILKKMESEGVLTRSHDEGDTRLKKIALSEAGLRMHEQISEHFSETVQKVFKGIDEKEIEVFYKVSRQMIANLEDMQREL